MTTYDDQFDEKKVSRRGFIKGATVTALAAGTFATGQAVLQNGTPQQAVITSAPISPITTAVPSTTSLNTQEADLISQIANLHADNLRLQTELSSSQQQLLNLNQAAENETISTEALTIELDNTNQQLGLLAGLVGLYEQFDLVDIDKVVDKGLTAVSNTLTNLLDNIPGLEEGIQLGQVALDDFEAQLPILQNGRQWLSRHFEQLNIRFSAVETILQETVERIGPLLDMLQIWFDSVKKWLPFNIGQRATSVMETITNLVLETPHTLNGMATNIAEPLDLLLSDSETEHPVQRNLVNPIRDKLIAKSNTAVAKTHQLHATYANELEIPVKTAVDRQKIIHQLIVQYREQHNL